MRGHGMETRLHYYHNALKIILSRIWEINKQMNKILDFSLLALA
jgi:hypothetical protein